MRGSSLKISFSRCWFCIRCHFLISILFRLGKARWFADLFLYCRAVFLSAKFNKITFYGYRFDQEGLRPTPEKVQSIHECEPPRSKTEVTSLLGITGYLSKFIPRYASLTKPLRDLTRIETKFHWGSTEDKAFKDVKAAITSKDTIAFFNPKLPIIVRVEARYNEGLSAGLFQQSGKGWQPVHFISRSLTDVEKRYNQR